MRALSLVIAMATAVVAQSNLPPLPTGVFTASTRIEIAAPLELVWNIILDFGSYPEWNPFVRQADVTDALGVPAVEQRAVQGAFANFVVEIPPLPLPVNASTSLDLLHTQFSRESIVTVDDTLHRAAWKQVMFPDIAINATRWSAVSTLSNGNTLYESAEPYNGLLAPLLQSLLADGLQQSFDAQAQGLKIRAESLTQ